MIYGACPIIILIASIIKKKVCNKKDTFWKLLARIIVDTIFELAGFFNAQHPMRASNVQEFGLLGVHDAWS